MFPLVSTEMKPDPLNAWMPGVPLMLMPSDSVKSISERASFISFIISLAASAADLMSFFIHSGTFPASSNMLTGLFKQ